MHIEKITVGFMEMNCYIIEENNDCLIIDPGSEAKKIINYIKGKHLNVLAILLTHSHFDHIGAVDSVADYFKCEVYIQQNGVESLKNPAYNLSTNYGNLIIKTEPKIGKGEMKIGDFEFIWLHLPGHCPENSMIYFPKFGSIFSGDVLFKGAIGSYDFINSSVDDTKKTINKISNYNFDAVVYPGHGPKTTIKEEQLNNPFLRN